jgi:hypothetical protein
MSEFPSGYEWLGDFPLPKTIGAALFVQDVDDWVLHALAFAGKILAINPDQHGAMGEIGVSDLSLVPREQDDDGNELPLDPRIFEMVRPDLSVGARRLKLESVFDPARVGEPTDEAALGNLAIRADGAAGFVVGVQGKAKLHVLTSRREVSVWARKGVMLRKPPATNGVWSMVPIAVDAKGAPDKAAHPELWEAAEP